MTSALSLQIHGGNVWRAAARLGVAPSEIVDFSASINPLGPSPRALRAIRGHLKDLSSYPDPVCSSLVETIADYHKVSPRSILVGNGSTELIYLVARSFGEQTLIPLPSFSDYERSVRLAGGRCRFLAADPSSGFQIDPNRLGRSLRRGDSLIFLGNPNNPTGQRHSAGLLRDLVKTGGRKGVRIALDEAFIDFWEEDSLSREAVESRNLIILRSFTKFFALAGLRIGYLIAHPEIVALLGKYQEPWTVNTLAQVAAQASLGDQAYIRESRVRMEETRPEFVKGLQALKGLVVFPSGANYLLFRVAPPRSASRLAESLLQKGVLIRDAGSFRGIGPEFLRVAVKSKAENRLLLRLLPKVLRF